MSTTTEYTVSYHRAPDSGIRMSTGITGALNAEWDQLGHSPAPATWATHPALAQHTTPAAALEHNRTCSHRDSDALMHALLTLGQEGDSLARRTLLQCMLGKVRRLSRTAIRREVDGAMSAALAACWEAICDYPLHRTEKVAGNLALETLARIPQAQRAEHPVEPDTITDLQGYERDLVNIVTPDARDEDPTQLVARTLAWALDQGVLTADAVRLLARLHLVEEGDQAPTMTELADEVGISYVAIRRRHSRAVQRLAQAVSDHLNA